MAGSKTAYLSQKLLDLPLGQVAWVPPTNLFVVVSLAAFDPSQTGAISDEVTAAGYARLEIANDDTTWSDATLGAPSEKHNLLDWVWDAATAEWGTPASLYLADAADIGTGNLLYGCDLNDSSEIDVGDTFKVLATNFIVNED